MNDDERSFSLGEKFFAHLRRGMLSFALPLVVLALAVVLLLHPPGVQVETRFILIFACVMIPLVLFAAWRGYKKLVASFEGFRLFVSHDRLRRVQPGYPDIEIARGEVTRIVEVPGKGLTVFGPGRQQYIGIHAALDGFEEVRALLVTWRTPEQRRSILPMVALILGALLTLVGCVVIIGSDDKLLVTVFGLAQIGLFLYCIVVMRKSPHLDARTRKSVWFFPFIILVVALRIWVVWHPM